MNLSNYSEVFPVGKTEAGIRIDKLISVRFPELSRSKWQELIKTGSVTVDGSQIKPSYQVSAGERVEIRVPEDFESESLVPQDLPLEVVYEDSSLIGINKPNSMVVHPGPGHEKDTLANGLIYLYENLPNLPDPTRPGIVHRLDKETSGILVVARTAEVFFDLKDQFKKREVDKEYLALVEGSFDERSGLIDAPVGRSNKDKTRMTVKLGGKDAKTEFWVIEEREDSTLLKVKPVTGRTHQIRVHMNYIDHKIIGDSYYGGPTAERLMLHARQITVKHPEKETDLTLEAPVPEEFKDA
ncbi:RluA family pseudouridine synthase [Candidatus Bipolaricaulota bacterium]|nr:RluA family pseudouridine synthase [Candidatus Bipolaricaulota bacterium]